MIPYKIPRHRRQDCAMPLYNSITVFDVEF